MDLHEGVDELVADPPALFGVVERLGDVDDDHLAEHQVHQVEGRADDRLVGARSEDQRDARRGIGERRQEARLAQHVVGARRQRRPRRAAQHEAHIATVDAVRHVGVALADRRGFYGSPGAEAVLVEERRERLEHEQRNALVCRALLVGGDDVVGGYVGAHRRNAIRCDGRRRSGYGRS